MTGIRYSTEISDNHMLFELYERLNWNSFLKLNEEQLIVAMQQSWYTVYAFDNNFLIGTGRVISDGIINGYLCGLGVLPQYRKRGIGTEISRLLVEECQKNNLHIQFFCEEKLVTYYEKMGFKSFAIGMKY